MKVIDSRGRLFGVVNIIDAGVVLLLLVLVFGGAYRFSGAPGSGKLESNKKEILVNFMIEDVRQFTVDVIALGDKPLDPTAREAFGEIVDLQVYPHQKAVETADGKIVLAEVPMRYNIHLTLKSNAHVSREEVRVASYILRVGARVVLQTKDYAVTATVLSVEIPE